MGMVIMSGCSFLNLSPKCHTRVESGLNPDIKLALDGAQTAAWQYVLRKVVPLFANLSRFGETIYGLSYTPKLGPKSSIETNKTFSFFCLAADSVGLLQPIAAISKLERVINNKSDVKFLFVERSISKDILLSMEFLTID